MPLLREIHEWATREMEKGNGDLHTNPIVIVEHLVQERIKNVRQKTRFMWETGTPEGYTELNQGKDRLMQIIGNKVVAVSIGAILWKQAPEAILRRLAEGQEENNESLSEA